MAPIGLLPFGEHREIWAIASEPSEPKKTRGTDWSVRMRLQDETEPEGIMGLKFDNPQGLPKHFSGRVVVRLSHVKLETWNDRRQVTASRKSEVIMFESSLLGSRRPIEQRADVRLSPNAKRMIDFLRAWNHFVCSGPSPPAPTISQLQPPPQQASTTPEATLAEVERTTVCERHLPAPITTHKHGQVPATDIASVRSSPRDTFKFRVIARVVGVSPRDWREFTRPYCTHCMAFLPSQAGSFSAASRSSATCPSCLRQDAEVDFSYIFQLQLADATGILDVLAWRRNAAEFFHGLPPLDLHENRHAADMLHQKIQRMIGQIVDVCIFSYRLGDVPSSQGRRYQLFDTTLVGPNVEEIGPV